MVCNGLTCWSIRGVGGMSSVHGTTCTVHTGQGEIGGGVDYNWHYSCLYKPYYTPTMLDSLMFHPSPTPPPPHPGPRIVTSTFQQLWVQPTEGMVVRQAVSHLQQVCFARDGTPSTPFRSGRRDRGRTWQGLLSVHLLPWQRGHRRRRKEVQVHIPNWKAACPYPQLEKGPECITIAPKGVPFLSDMHNNTP